MCVYVYVYIYNIGEASQIEYVKEYSMCKDLKEIDGRGSNVLAGCAGRRCPCLFPNSINGGPTAIDVDMLEQTLDNICAHPYLFWF